MSDVARAIKTAAEIHGNDKYGSLPYMFHLALTAYNVSIVSDDNNVIIVAWLHDAIEDHPECEERIREEFPEQFSTIKLLARPRTIAYNDYIDSIVTSGDEKALIVKLADIETNLWNKPLTTLRKRYERAKKIIEESLYGVL